MQLLRGFLLLVLAVSTAGAQFEFPGLKSFSSKRHTRARLVLSHEAAKPGDTILAGVELMMDPGWHTYWQNPGADFGLPTEIFWDLPRGMDAGETQWPLPERYVDKNAGDVVNYVYHQRAVLVVPLKIAADASSGELELAALVKWLECETSCIPGSNLVRGTLMVTNQSKLNSDTNFFAEAQRLLPSKQLPGTAIAKWIDAPDATNRAFVIEWSAGATEPDFYPYTNPVASISAKTAVLTISPSNVVLRKTAQREADAWPKQVAGLLVRKENDRLAAYEVTLTLPESGSVSAASSSSAKKSLLGWLVYAFIGGLILNIMPCVLPVIALKILGFVNQNRENPRRVRTLGLLYTLGIVTSFLVLAGIVIGLKAAGQKVGWGIQFSNPQFIVVLAVIVTLVALNLFGVFEITLGGGAMTAASGAASRHGSAGAFMNGVLATVLATPCTAPFLGVALGFAFAQPPHIIVLFFITIAIGLASPYLLLSYVPAWLKFLPKPGAWMERFKVAMGFPMLATAVWLFTLTSNHYGKRVWWLGVFLVVVALAAWIYGEFVQRGRTRRGISLVITLLLLAGGYLYAVENKLHWREALTENSEGEAETFQDVPNGITWRRWSEANVAKFRAEGRPILVDFTAEWCVTCNTVVKPALESDAVKAKLKQINAVAMLADYTKYPPSITAELEKFGRAGVPMVLVYPKDASKPAIVIAETLLPATQARLVLEALDKASK